MSPRPPAAQQARNDRVDRMVELFVAGHSVDYVCEEGLAGGWTRGDVLTLVRQRGWPLDGSGRLPLRMRGTHRRGAPQRVRDRVGRPLPRPLPAVGPRPVSPLAGVYAAVDEWSATPETPTERTAPEASVTDAAGTAPDPSGPGHGYAGPDAQGASDAPPQVSPSRSSSGKGGGLGASDAPAAPPATGSSDDWAWTWDPATKSYSSRGAGDQRTPAPPVLPPATATATPVDVLALGLEHAHPAVRAKAKLVQRAVDDLCTALTRHHA